MRFLLPLLLLTVLASGCDTLGGDGGGDTSERLFPARQNGTVVLIDATGRVAVTLEGYNYARGGAEGLTPARREGSPKIWDYYRADGEIAFSVQADEALAPSEGRVRVKIDGKFAFVDTEGRFLINPYLNEADDFSEGLARIRTTGSTWGFLDRDGQIVVPPTFQELGDLRDNRALFKRDGKYGFVDRTGAVVIPAVYDDARSFSDGRAAVKQGQRWFYIDINDGRLADGQTFISAGDYREGRAPVRTENPWEFVDGNGVRVIEPQFQGARAFRGGRAAVKMDDVWTFVRPDGSFLRAPEFDEVDDFAGGLAAVYLGNKVGYIDGEGTTVWLPRN